MRYTRWKKNLSGHGLLYAILDKKIIEEADLDIFSLTDELAHCGVDIFQLRVKETADKKLLQLARRLTKIIHKRRRIFIVNDRADIAYLSEADGLHIGKNDISPKEARKILGEKAILGSTVHSLGELRSFQKAKTNYIGIGPAFKTKTKPSLTPLRSKELRTMISNANKLVFAIGGINLYNVGSLIAMGIQNVAVCRGLILCKDLKEAVREYKECLAKAF